VSNSWALWYYRIDGWLQLGQTAEQEKRHEIQVRPVKEGAFVEVSATEISGMDFSLEVVSLLFSVSLLSASSHA
jgi:hypothetical protein